MQLRPAEYIFWLSSSDRFMKWAEIQSVNFYKFNYFIQMWKIQIIHYLILFRKDKMIIWRVLSDFCDNLWIFKSILLYSRPQGFFNSISIATLFGLIRIEFCVLVLSKVFLNWVPFLFLQTSLFSWTNTEKRMPGGFNTHRVNNTRETGRNDLYEWTTE